MEQLNRIEIRGVVGATRLQIVNDRQMAKLTVATNYAYKNREGVPVIETTWHNVAAFESKNVKDLDKIEKGSKVQVVGRLQKQQYQGADGIDRTVSEIIANKLVLIPDDENLQYEF